LILLFAKILNILDIALDKETSTETLEETSVVKAVDKEIICPIYDT